VAGFRQVFSSRRRSAPALFIDSGLLWQHMIDEEVSRQQMKSSESWPSLR
jgi:hypothetical protein